MKRIGLDGKEYEVLCRGCSNPDWTWLRNDGEGEKCNKCGAEPPRLAGYFRDYTEKALKEGMPPGNFRDRCIERHRKEVAHHQRSMPRVVKNSSQFQSGL